MIIQTYPRSLSLFYVCVFFSQGLDVSFAAFLAVILGLFIPVVFLVTLYIQSDAQGTATSFRQPDSIGGTRYEDE